MPYRESVKVAKAEEKEIKVDLEDENKEKVGGRLIVEASAVGPTILTTRGFQPDVGVPTLNSSMLPKISPLFLLLILHHPTSRFLVVA